MAAPEALTPDFDSHPVLVDIVGIERDERWVSVSWSDERVSRFHHLWLRDNCPCPDCVHRGTREQIFEIVSVPADIRPLDVAIGSTGTLVVRWDEGQPDRPSHCSAYHPGWLRRHAYDDASRSDRRRSTILWDGATMAVPPTFDGPSVLADDDALHGWLTCLDTTGVSLVSGVFIDPDALAVLVGRIGIIRETNFGVVWDVRSEPAPISNANTALALPPHVDLPTREYQPGLQFLHCLVNETEGGDSILLDGFRLAALLRDEHPADYEVLTTVAFDWANRSSTTDHRWTSPVIVTDTHGEVTEVRVGNWLRAPLDVPFDVVEACYAAYRRLFELTYRPDLQLRFRLEPGDVMAFDNRRVLHARSAFADTGGRRLLRGCYSERDELRSRLRILERNRRARSGA